MNILKYKDIVFQLLSSSPMTRDNDTLLISLVWDVQLKQKDYVGSRDFLDVMRLGYLAKPESVTRARRKIQENNPLLRGKTHGKRQEEQLNVLNQLNQWEENNEHR